MSYRVASLWLVLGALSTVITEANVRILYTLSMPRPSTHIFHVEMHLEGLPAADSLLDLQLPVWRPGRYMVLNFAGGVIRFEAEAQSGKSLSFAKADKSTWRIETEGSTGLVARYDVFADEFKERTRGLDDEHAFVNGAALFMYAPRYRASALELEVIPPKHWHVTSGLGPLGQTRFAAPNYDTFVDCPLEIGQQKDFTFDVDGIPHVLSIYGEGSYDADTLTRDFTKIIRTQRAFWGSTPYARYVFLLHCMPNAGGGTEHLNSTIIGTQPFAFSNPDSYREFLSVVSHEFFHTWNVKQLRPAPLSHPDFQRENYVEELWMAEGTTSYYDKLLLVRAGLMSREKFLFALAQMLYRDRSRPGNAVQSLAESGYDAWIKYWQENREAFNAEVDYYEKGMAVSLLLDLEIRGRTANAHTLDDLMRTLLARFPRSSGGYTNADVRRLAAELGGPAMNEVFDDFIYKTLPLPWERALGYAGLEVIGEDNPPQVWTGMELSDMGGRTGITRVSAGSPAADAGLDTDDELLAVDGFRMSAAEFSRIIAPLKPGKSLRLTVFRGGKLREFSLTLAAPAVLPCSVRESAQMTPVQKEILDSWLPQVPAE
ncbi:MAG TPA: PDZ domain-containing protein [Bacteroidota bacterium]|nr:PDZ domain-containing protein [Bacteroidota bacterium]